MRFILVLLSFAWASYLSVALQAAPPSQAPILPAVSDDSPLSLDFSAAPAVDGRRSLWYEADQILGAYRFTGDFLNTGSVPVEIALFRFNPEGMGERVWSAELDAADPLTDIESDDVLPTGTYYLRFSVAEDAAADPVQLFYDFWYPWQGQQWQTLEIHRFLTGSIDQIEQSSTDGPYNTIWQAPMDGYLAFRLEELTYPGESISLVELSYDSATKEIVEEDVIATAETYRCYYEEWTALNDRAQVEEGKWYAVRLEHERDENDPVTIGALLEWTSAPPSNISPTDALPLTNGELEEQFSDVANEARYYRWEVSQDGRVYVEGNVASANQEVEYGNITFRLLEGDAESTGVALVPAYGDEVLTVHQGDVYQIEVEPPHYDRCRETENVVGATTLFLKEPANVSQNEAETIVMPVGVLDVYDYFQDEDQDLWYRYEAPEDGILEIKGVDVQLVAVATDQPLTPLSAELIVGDPSERTLYRFKVVMGEAYLFSLNPVPASTERNHYYQADFAFEFEDSDADGLADSWEARNFMILSATDGSRDGDNDGLSDTAEFMLASDPHDPNRNEVLQVVVVEGELQLIAVVNRSVSHQVQWQSYNPTSRQWEEIAVDQTVEATVDPSSLRLIAKGGALRNSSGGMFRLSYE
ncbi:MAG: hypothetical protein E1N59_829 [Puniceicoccaceae bacterium 5H]|nr:MAG: hypothetical protein E1N59_829 [Puniceicoccaceae bacterium 5H]